MDELKYDPAIVHEKVIEPILTKVENNLRKYFAGTLTGYDNVRQVVEEGLWEAFDTGIDTKELTDD